MYDQPIDPATIDLDRIRGLFELGVATHPDRGRVERYLRAGAEMTLTPGVGIVNLHLQLTDNAPALKLLREQVWGCASDIRPTDDELAAPLHIIDAPVAALVAVPDGTYN